MGEGKGLVSVIDEGKADIIPNTVGEQVHGNWS